MEKKEEGEIRCSYVYYIFLSGNPPINKNTKKKKEEKKTFYIKQNVSRTKVDSLSLISSSPLFIYLGCHNLAESASFSFKYGPFA